MTLFRGLSVALVAAALCLSSTPARADGKGGWVTDWSAALATAKKDKKDLLIDFTGSDWCGWCIRLDKEVFQHDEFRKDAPGKFVLVEIDFPRDSSGQSEELKAQNEKLQQEFDISGFPTILLADASGRPYARTGYQPGGPESYVKHLDELRAVRVKRDEHFDRASKTEGLERAKALSDGLDVLDPQMVFASYASVIDEIATLDADGAGGLKSKWSAGKKAFDFEKNVMTSLQSGEGDPKALIAEADAILKDTGKTGLVAQNVILMKAQITMFAIQGDLTSPRLPEVLAFIDEAIAAAPTSPMGAQLTEARKRIEAAAKDAKESAEENTDDSDENDSEENDSEEDEDN